MNQQINGPFNLGFLLDWGENIGIQPGNPLGRSNPAIDFYEIRINPGNATSNITFEQDICI